MSKQGIHRHTASSKAGRRISAANSPLRTGLSELTEEQKAWNARVEEKKLQKKQSFK